MTTPKTLKPFAAGTKVSSLSTMESIRKLLEKHGVKSFSPVYGENQLAIVWQMIGSDGGKRSYRYSIPVPDSDEAAFATTVDHARASRSAIPRTAEGAREKEIARVSRAILRIIEGRLIAVVEGAQTVESVFYSETVVTQDGRTVRDVTEAQILATTRRGELPRFTGAYLEIAPKETQR